TPRTVDSTASAVAHGPVSFSVAAADNPPIANLPNSRREYIEANLLKTVHRIDAHCSLPASPRAQQRLDRSRALRCQERERMVSAMLSRFIAVALIGLAVITWTGGAAAQSGADTPDLSGFWELRFDSFNVPKATLTPQAAAASLAAQEE